MAKKLDAILYVCLYVAIYFFANLIAGSIVPLFETLRLVVLGEIGWKYFFERLSIALEIGGMTVLHAISAMAVALILIWFVFLIRKRRLFGAIKTKKLYFRDVAGAILIAFGLQAIAALVMKIPFPSALFEIYGRNMSINISDNIILTLITVGILVPFFEEIFFRGVIYNELSTGGGFWFANFFQSLAFAVLHFDIIQGTYAFFIGFALGAVMKIGKSLYISVIIHIIFNASNILFGQYIGAIAATPYFIVCGIVALIIGYLLLIKKR